MKIRKITHLFANCSKLQPNLLWSFEEIAENDRNFRNYAKFRWFRKFGDSENSAIPKIRRFRNFGDSEISVIFKFRWFWNFSANPNHNPAAYGANVCTLQSYTRPQSKVFNYNFNFVNCVLKFTKFTNKGENMFQTINFIDIFLDKIYTNIPGELGPLKSYWY